MIPAFSSVAPPGKSSGERMSMERITIRTAGELIYCDREKEANKSAPQRSFYCGHHVPRVLSVLPYVIFPINWDGLFSMVNAKRLEILTPFAISTSNPFILLQFSLLSPLYYF
jgi:hypothetical protein